MVLQDPYLFHGTVLENIRYGKPEATLDEVIDAARGAGVEKVGIVTAAMRRAAGVQSSN